MLQPAWWHFGVCWQHSSGALLIETSVQVIAASVELLCKIKWFCFVFFKSGLSQIGWPDEYKKYLLADVVGRGA